MIGQYPIVGFDTSSHNRLVDDGPLSEPIFAGIRSGLFFRFAGLSIDELIATPDRHERAALFAACGRLQHGPTDCIYPHNELVKLLVRAHDTSPASFDWKAVDVRAREYERLIQDSSLIADDALSAQQRESLLQTQKSYKQVFAALRTKLERVFSTHGALPPPTFRDAVDRAQNASPNLVLSFAKMLYDVPAGTDAPEEIVEEFIRVCPPFRALVYAMLMTWYDSAVRDRHTGEKYQAGRNDLFMCGHLPYVDKFVTAEKKGEQQKCLREIAAVANLDTEILSYDDFCSGFLVHVG